MRIRTAVTALFVASCLVIAGPVPARASGHTYAASRWSDVAIDILHTNRKAIGWCAGNVAFLSYGGLRALGAIALRDRILSILSLATGAASGHCVATARAAEAAYRVWTVGGRDGSSFTVRDDSYVVVRRLLRPNECHLDLTVGRAGTGETWNYRTVYSMCGANTYA